MQQIWRCNYECSTRRMGKMRIAYQIRYAKLCKKVKESNTDNHGVLLEMSYVLITVFGITQKQVQEIERMVG